MEEEEQGLTNYARGYPKVPVVSCYCHVQNIYAKGGATAAATLCKNCAGWQAFFKGQYEKECAKAGISTEPTVELTLGI